MPCALTPNQIAGCGLFILLSSSPAAPAAAAAVVLLVKTSDQSVAYYIVNLCCQIVATSARPGWYSRRFCQSGCAALGVKELQDLVDKRRLQEGKADVRHAQGSGGSNQLGVWGDTPTSGTLPGCRLAKALCLYHPLVCEPLSLEAEPQVL